MPRTGCGRVLCFSYSGSTKRESLRTHPRAACPPGAMLGCEPGPRERQTGRSAAAFACRASGSQLRDQFSGPAVEGSFGLAQAGCRRLRSWGSCGHISACSWCSQISLVLQRAGGQVMDFSSIRVKGSAASFSCAVGG